MILVLDFWKSAGNFLTDAVHSIAAHIDALIYQLVSFLYKLFFFVSSTEIIQNDAFQSISKNFQLLVGVVVMFSISISLINYIVNPDSMKGGKTSASKLVTKVVTSLILLLTVNIIFSSAYRLQNAIIQNNFIGKLILGDKVTSYNIDDMGFSFSRSILSAFVTTNKERELYPDGIPQYMVKDAETLFSDIITKESQFKLLPDYINDKDENSQYILDYNILSILVGGFVAYILITYVVGVGVRVIQLFYLQVIAPIPILMYVLPNGDDKLKKWASQCMMTYLDLFIRHLIIYLTIFLCSNLLSAKGMIIIPSGAEDYKNWIIIALVLAIMLFAKKAPDLIKELFPSSSKTSGDFGLNLGKQIMGSQAGAAAVGGVAGATTGLLSGGGLGGMIGGFNRGIYGGLTGKKLSDTMSTTKKYGNMRRDKNIGLGGRMANDFREQFGIKDSVDPSQTQFSQYEKQMAANEAKIKLGNAITERAKSLAYRQGTDVSGASFTAGGESYNLSGNINDLKATIETARTSGSKTFIAGGKEIDIGHADTALKAAERFASDVVINASNDAQLMAMMDNIHTMDSNIIAANSLRGAVSRAEDANVQIQNSQDYINLKKKYGNK